MERRNQTQGSRQTEKEVKGPRRSWGGQWSGQREGQPATQIRVTVQVFNISSNKLVVVTTVNEIFPTFSI